ncbi:MAG TPA: dual specificity protein phosphatase family protein [Thermodesulfovibrionales bacterium]|nr:dual specificity protein phosphatase family protein [Thermodesulfovibrionales bacterium]
MTLRKKIGIAASAFLLFASASYFLYMEEQGNFHAVTSGEAYRSAQLDRDELEYYIRKYDIKSIVNLRGRNPDAPWYKEEAAVSSENKITHYDISLSATREPSEDDVRRLISIFRSAPRPVLIHCQAGADRSGLAAAIWKVVIDNESKPEAEKQLSIVFGHIPIGKTSAMDRFFRNWTPEYARRPDTL